MAAYDPYVYHDYAEGLHEMETPLDLPLFDPAPRLIHSANGRMFLVLAAVLLIVPLLAMARPRPDGAARAAGGPAAGGDQAAVAQVAAPAGRLSPVFSPEVRYWEARIVAWAAAFGLDPDLAAIIMQIESCGDPQAVSGAGAQGLFQVMPFHFSDGENMLDPDANARRGLNYYAERLVQTNGDIGRAFAGYNGGHVAAAASWDSWAHETQRYYVWSTGIYGDIQQGLTESPTLQQWMAAGGASLCRQAAGRLGL